MNKPPQAGPVETRIEGTSLAVELVRQLFKPELPKHFNAYAKIVFDAVESIEREQKIRELETELDLLTEVQREVTESAARKELRTETSNLALAGGSVLWHHSVSFRQIAYALRMRDLAKTLQPADITADTVAAFLAVLATYEILCRQLLGELLAAAEGRPLDQ
jgi:hypothetical protein